MEYMEQSDNYYLSVGRASDLKDKKERFLFRLFEILPGFLSWLFLFLIAFFSWFRPVWVAIFAIIFSVFWFFRTIYFSFCLWIGYKKMRAQEKINWMGKLRSLPTEKLESIYHLVVIPMYKEPIEVVKDSFKRLVETDYPKDKMIVVLACEERAREEASIIAEKIEQDFGDKFFKFLITWHPAGLQGEIAGKGSNEARACKKAMELVDSLGIPYGNIIFSSFDVDTCVFSRYFSCLTYYYLTSLKPNRTSFQPVPLYVNNIWQAPVISRIFSFSSTFWHTMNQERSEQLITFSSHSMSFEALVEVGFKQVNAVSDDSRIFWKCFSVFNGDYTVFPLYYPVSMDANTAGSFFRTMLNIYKQQRRWAYGAENIPYFLFCFFKNKKIPPKQKIFLGFEAIEGYVSWSTSSIVIFILGWLPLFFGGAEFSHTLISYNLPKIISRIMTFSMLGLVASVYLSLILLPPKPPQYGKFRYLVFAFSWLLLPLMMIFFTAFPALEAQTRLMFGKYMGFWVTEKSRKK
ncbi:MAG: hypothetical protein UT22_C0006G0007 [Parcubacteria group bacterium GW2011_GWC2_39_11]|nr:MAG: hypothetical protein US88_C0006G0008 [Parcubacteria group bacterium GW2011_GWA2_38_27]KKQ97926.1 MAG: hypothetical protein UT22_C0006G0007 [Parcubacteria group bacterium GW2011_GWC2_39_11]